MNEKIDPWKDYTDRANNFADWFTAVIISNFAYLIDLLKIKNYFFESMLERKVYLWDMYISCFALVYISIIKGLGVWAASRRVDKGLEDECQRKIEDLRFGFSIAFVALVMISVSLSTIILQSQFNALIR